MPAIHDKNNLLYYAFSMRFFFAELYSRPATFRYSKVISQSSKVLATSGFVSVMGNSFAITVSVLNVGTFGSIVAA